MDPIIHCMRTFYILSVRMKLKEKNTTIRSGATLTIFLADIGVDGGVIKSPICHILFGLFAQK